MMVSVHGDPLAALGGIQSGGQNVYVRELTVVLDRMGYHVDVFTHWTDPNTPQVEPLGDNSQVIRLGAGRKCFVPKDKLFHLLPGFLRELRQWGHQHHRTYRLVHSNYWYSGWVGRQLRRLLAIPQVHISHSLGLVKAMASQETSKPVIVSRLREERRILHRADAVVATSPPEQEVLHRSYAVPWEKIRLIPCGVDPSLFRPRDRAGDRTRLGIKEQKVILYVGRLEKTKGLEILLRAFSRITSAAGNGSGVELWIAGGSPAGAGIKPGPFEDHLRSLCHNLGINERVRFLGPVAQQELPVYYSAADVCVIPSFYESFGLVAIEAMACGCPVVASRVGGLSYTVKHGLTGLTVEPRDPERLAQGIIQVLGDENFRHTLSENASARVAKCFTWPQVARQMAELYCEVAGCGDGDVILPGASS
ncbi:hypothetical protein SY88_12820 [Clostridiales bacterium PH28_bin88]|nr:hypothetical protein SY88_12820 [Clostridiales bacterium PH28_bin88]